MIQESLFNSLTLLWLYTYNIYAKITQLRMNLVKGKICITFIADESCEMEKLNFGKILISYGSTWFVAACWSLN